MEAKFYLENEQTDQGNDCTEGDCPVCGEEESLIRGEVFVKIGTLDSYWECSNCKSKGVEVYDIEFKGHKVLKEEID